MSYYRVWEYPQQEIPYKHVYIKGPRPMGGAAEEKPDRKGDRASENGAGILDALANEERFSQSLSRSRRSITDLILCNAFTHFCTFTFSAGKVDRYNYGDCKRSLRKFFNNFQQRQASDFKYLIIPELHKDGAVHFHGMIMGMPEGELVVPEQILKRVDGELCFVPNTPGYLAWPRYAKAFGHFNCSPIRHYGRCAFYVTKYVTKDLLTMDKGTNVYMCSQGLKRPELVFDNDDIPLMFRPEYENEFCCVKFENAVNTADYIPDKLWWYGDAQSWPEGKLEPDLVFFDVVSYEQLSFYAAGKINTEFR